MNLFWKIVLWVLFWYYLAPYYLLKKYVFNKAKHQVAWSAISSLAIVFLLFSAIGNTNDSENDTAASSPKTHVVVKKVGEKKLVQAKAKRKVLLAEEKKKQAEYDKLSAELQSDKEKKVQEAKAEKAKEKAAAKKAAQAQRQACKNTTKTSDSTTDDSDSSTESDGGSGNRDLDTAETGKIVGNANSKIFHVPGQAGYHMDSANAVYFKSEQDAINAGYRKAKR